ncbi:hypothetical protein ACKVMQ_11745, partial [Faecalibacterium hattorii]
MSMTTPIVDFVRSYAKSGTSRLHMPGHKGQKLLGFEDADITEIKGADELYEAEGIIAESEANATKLFGTAHTYYSTEGSSQCIRAMLCLALAGGPGGAAARSAGRPQRPQGAALRRRPPRSSTSSWLGGAPEAAGAVVRLPGDGGAVEQALERLSGQGDTPFGVYVTSPDDPSAGCRISRPFPRSATPTVSRFWWTTPTARTLNFLVGVQQAPHGAGGRDVLRLRPQDPARP